MTALQGANAERKAVRAKLRRLLRQEADPYATPRTLRDLFEKLIVWLNKRDDRYNKRPGGLQRRVRK